jgi:hypothetical protein
MKTFRYYLLVVCVLLARWSAAQKEEIRNPGPFSGIDVSDKVLVQLVRSGEESLDIRAQRSDASGVITDVEDNTLKIRVRGSSGDFGKVNIILKYRYIDEISVSGIAKVFAGKALVADAETGGYISYRGNPAETVFNRGAGGKIVKADLR